mmetsp:Transcript_1348/g.1752  ORF Transcript_1348/g.1752 Transcript_1348/m.1752 type:complete len:166 (+) Transcript_1348:1133-1630(+)
MKDEDRRLCILFLGFRYEGYHTWAYFIYQAFAILMSMVQLPTILIAFTIIRWKSSQDILQGVSKLDYLLKVSIFQIQKKKALPAVAQSVRPKSNMHSFAFDGDSQFDELSSDGESEFDRRASTIVYYDDEAIEKLDYRVSRAVGGSYANGEFERLRKTATPNLNI